MTARDFIDSVGQKRALEGGGLIAATKVEVNYRVASHVKLTITFDCWLPLEVASELERPRIADAPDSLPRGAPRLGNA